MSISEELRQLQDLHQSGALTDEEFTLAKQKLLSAGNASLASSQKMPDHDHSTPTGTSGSSPLSANTKANADQSEGTVWPLIKKRLGPALIVAAIACVALCPNIRKPLFRGMSDEVQRSESVWKISQYPHLKDYSHILDERGIKIIYSDNITKDEAQALLDYVSLQGLFGKSDGRELCLSRVQNRMVVKMSILPDIANDPKLKKEAPILARMISDDVFKKVPVTFHVCDNQLNTVFSVNSEE